MKRVFSRTCGVILTAALTLAGCLSESTQAQAVNNQPAKPALTTVAAVTPAPTPQVQQAPVAPAPAPMEFREGVHYTVISPPIPTQVPPGKTEVVEMFWYGCPHCRALEPTLNKFLQTKPDNVVFRRVPATLSPRWAFHAKLFYVGQMLDPTGAKHVHIQIFEALHTQRREINDEDAMQRFFANMGFTPDQVKGAMQSMEMQADLARSDEIGQRSKADSVPVIIINGKYMTSPSRVGSEENLLQAIKYLSSKP
ncbi:MAG: thiol:disulfide interchange protein DsbA/DsbL [Thiothrix sp.]|uniref:thiol:disulfide interchange protein DsbA/DsbL n=1 Tax=Thiothrix sp. TaxID=1032 RepID=UPI00261B2168|nr:thiol:disulfide interchange protein DsbA/DsbL [Thiothrix sp.]MDD5393294.1 thiol:disulfide interchange protein DsbA/DsbL [Thiothrix sp.]